MEALMTEDRFDLLINDTVERHFPDLLVDLTEYGWLWVKAQVWQESRFDPAAESPAGALGLMQLMPGTAAALGVTDPLDPVQNVGGGVRYLAEQYRHLGEIPYHAERMRMALASYNGGRGYINKALELARISEGFPGPFDLWRRAGSPPGYWQDWHVVSACLKGTACLVDGRHPDYHQMIDYAAKIEGRYHQYLEAAGAERRSPAWG
jgi:peptidoglycan lytic transglycosylase F